MDFEENKMEILSIDFVVVVFFVLFFCFVFCFCFCFLFQYRVTPQTTYW